MCLTAMSHFVGGIEAVKLNPSAQGFSQKVLLEFELTTPISLNMVCFDKRYKVEQT